MPLLVLVLAFEGTGCPHLQGRTIYTILWRAITHLLDRLVLYAGVLQTLYSLTLEVRISNLTLFLNPLSANVENMVSSE
jgi:hypothetical protein